MKKNSRKIGDRTGIGFSSGDGKSSNNPNDD